MIGKRNIILIGPMGSGKSTVGRQLSKYFNMEFFDSDQEIQNRTGADISWIFDTEGEKGFRKREKKIINELTESNNKIISTGGGSIKSKEIRNRLISRGIVIYLQTTVENQFNRTKRDKSRPLLNIDDRKKILEFLSHERNHLYEEIADIIVCTDNHNIKSVTRKIINILLKI
ncbi:MAG: shikimate kinase AroK [Enterobacterales bacterium]